MRFCYSLLLWICLLPAFALPPGFVYLSDIDPSIIQEMRYAGAHNFVGKPIDGYEVNECILTKSAAYALAKVQKDLRHLSLSLKVYDCYRPVRAVTQFIAWSRDLRDQTMKDEFYPSVNKADFFSLGFVAERSGHNRGSTIDLTLVPIPTPAEPDYRPGQTLVACTAAYAKRYADNSINMGTGFDCMDDKSSTFSAAISVAALENRLQLRKLMKKHGFAPYDKEWWHFTLKQEPYPQTYFDFPVQ